MQTTVSPGLVDHRVPDRLWRNAGLAIIILCAVVRLVFISTTLVVDDESYYYVWTHHLAGGYIDGGPVIGYINKLFVLLFGVSGFSVRFGAVAQLTALSLFLLYWGAKRFNARTGFLLAMLTTLTPICFGIGIVHTYDTEMAFFMLIAIALYYDAFFVDERKFYLAGVFLGLALLAKISVVFSAFAIFLLPFLVKDLRVLLRRKAFYLSFVIAALIFSPFIYWNLTHDLAFIRFKGGMAFRSGDLSDFLDVWLAQAGLFLPIVFWFAVMLPFRTIARAIFRHEHAPQQLYFALVAAFPLCYFVSGSLFSRYYGNWVLPAFFGGLFLTALHFGANWEKYRVPALIHGVCSAALLAVVIGHVYLDFLPMPNPYALRAAMPTEIKAYFAAHPELQQLRIVGNDYQVPSMVNMYLHPPIEAIGLSLAGYHDTLYTMLYPPRTLAGQNFLFLYPSEKFPDALRAHFATVKKMQTFVSRRHGKVAGRLTLWYVTGFDGRQ